MDGDVLPARDTTEQGDGVTDPSWAEDSHRNETRG